MLSAQSALLNTSKDLTTCVPRVSLQARNERARNTQLPRCTHHPIARDGRPKAVIGEKNSTEDIHRMKTSRPRLPSEGAIDVTAVVTIRKRMKEKLVESVQEEWQSFVNGIGKGIVVQLISEETDPVTNEGKKSVEAPVRGWMPKPSFGSQIDEFTANFKVPPGFGRPGAVLVTNLQNKEFYLMEIIVHGFATGPLFFPANSWIHPRNHSQESRIIFRNQAHLPSQTPDGLKGLRQRELTSLRGDGTGERTKHDRIYDYDVYNDLGNPDEGIDLARPILGGEQIPYPRRCRTGRPPSKSDPTAESRIEKPDPVYVPRDETFEEIKKEDFAAGRLRAVLHNLIPAITGAISSSSDLQFKSFTEIDGLYEQGVAFGERQGRGPPLAGLIKKLFNIGEQLLRFEIPSVISRDRFCWLRDNEFGRQALAGLNPASIERLREFPIRSKLDPAVYGPPESAITKEILEEEMNGMSVEEAIEQHRLFILDFHDVLLPFIEDLNSMEDRKSYATRTVLFYNEDGLRPIAIELSLPPTPSLPQRKKVCTQGNSGTATWIWKWAKAHVCSNDSGVHQLVNHWLRTHACMEAYAIAAHRQLSAMHPIFKLLDPHMRYTLEINALARQSLINEGGVIEDCFFPGKHSMEISAAAYDSMWRFDMEGLPADLLRRGMAVEDPSMPCGVRLVIEDYPYAADGLLIWTAIEEWVRNYATHFYPEDGAVVSDVELQGWWEEVRNKGHADKRNAEWWPRLRTVGDLVGVLTTIVWTASAQHAALNFGQYPFGGYMPNRPTLMKKLIPDPEEDVREFERFIRHPQFVFLSSLPSLLQSAKVMSVQDTLSSHSPDEEYLGDLLQTHAHWIDDAKVLDLYRNFSSRLEEAERNIHERNADECLTNRSGAGIPPYELLIPKSVPGVTGRGIPNSVSI